MNNHLYDNSLQLHLQLESKAEYSQHIKFLDKLGIKPSPIYEQYWRFAAERQHIFQKRRDGCSYPWTNDCIFQKYKFTNAYRASDRVSQYLIRNVIYPEHHSFSPEDVFLELYFLRYLIKSKHGKL